MQRLPPPLHRAYVALQVYGAIQTALTLGAAVVGAAAGVWAALAAGLPLPVVVLVAVAAACFVTAGFLWVLKSLRAGRKQRRRESIPGAEALAKDAEDLAAELNQFLANRERSKPDELVFPAEDKDYRENTARVQAVDRETFAQYLERYRHRADGLMDRLARSGALTDSESFHTQHLHGVHDVVNMAHVLSRAASRLRTPDIGSVAE